MNQHPIDVSATEEDVKARIVLQAPMFPYPVTNIPTVDQRTEKTHGRQASTDAVVLDPRGQAFVIGKYQVGARCDEEHPVIRLDDKHLGHIPVEAAESSHGFATEVVTAGPDGGRRSEVGCHEKVAQGQAPREESVGQHESASVVCRPVHVQDQLVSKAPEAFEALYSISACRRSA